MENLLTKVKYELSITEKFVNDFAYASTITEAEAEEINIYRKELVELKLQLEESMNAVKLGLPNRPSWTDKYL